MSNFTANFRLYHRGRSFRKDELALIESLERQRHRTGRVRAIIDDPAGKYPAVLQAYITYIQHLDRRDALIVEHPVEQAISLRPNPRQNFRPSTELQRSRVSQVTPRSYLRLLCPPRPIGQILLLNAHAYCPSLPLSRSRLDQILQIVIPYANGPNSLLIIHGSTRTPKRTRFHHWVAQAISLRPTPTTLYMLYSGAESSAHCKPRSPRRPVIVEWRPSHGRKPLTIIINNSDNESHPALPPRRAPLKIAA